MSRRPFSRKVATQPAIFQSPLINALSSAPYHVTQSLHRQRSALVAPVNHCMAVRAQWDQLCYRVDLVSLAQCCQRPDVMHMNKSPPLFAICFFKIKSAALADSPVMPDTYPSRFRVPFIGINRDLSLCTLNIASGNGEFFRKGVCRKIGIPYGSLFSQKPVIETAFKVLNDCNGRIVWMRRVDHIKGEQLVALHNKTNMFNGLRVTWLSLVPGVELPLFPENNRPLLLALHVPGTKDNLLIVMIYE